MSVITPPAVFTTKVSKTVAFTGAAGLGAQGTVALFTITGRVFIDRFIATCSEDLASAGGTISVGTASDTDQLIAATTATSIDSTNVWASNADTPGANTLGTASSLTATAQTKKMCSESIIATVATADITDGTITFTVEYEPLTVDGSLVAA